MRARLSIAVVAPLVAPLSVAHPYGNQHFVCDLARALVALGHDVVVYAAAGSRIAGVPLETVEVPRAVRGRFVLLRDNDPSESAAMAEAFERLFARVRARRPDVVSQHAFDREAIAACDGTPALHTLHLPPSSEPVVAAVRESHSAFCSVSHDCASRWSDAARRPVLALPNGVPRFEAPVASAEAFALVAGRISREKGVATAVRVARRASLTPVVIGEIYDADYFHSEVAPVLDPASVIPSLPRASLARVMARASALLMPIEWDEPFGLVAVEAQRAGCPVVGFRRGALPEIVADGVDGFLVDPGDEDALIVALRDAGRLDRAAIRARSAHRYGMDACARRYEAALRALAGDGTI